MAADGTADLARAWLASGVSAETAWRIVAAALAVGLAFAVSQVYRSTLKRLRGAFEGAAPFTYIVEQLGAYAILIAGFAIGVTTLGLDLSSLALFGGAVGVGVGLGLQGVVKEFVSGIVLIFDATVQVGDFVEIADEVHGEIVEIGPRAVRLRTNDGLSVVVPNSVFIQSRLVNWTYNDESRRIHVPFSVAEESDIGLVRDVVLQAARDLHFTLPEDHRRKTQVWLTGFAGDGLNFDLVVWPKPEATRHPRSLHAAYTWAIYQALQAAGVRNSQNQLDVELRGGVFEGERGQSAASVKAGAVNDAAATVGDEVRATRDREASRRRRPHAP